MVSQLPPEHLTVRAARRARSHARRRSRAPAVALLLLLACCVTIAGLLARPREPATAAATGAPGFAPEPVSRERPPPDLVLPNAGFEAGTEGWRPVSARLTRATPGRDGDGAARVAPGPTTETDEEGPGIRAFAVIASTPGDTQVIVTAWARALQPGTTVLLKVIERQNDRSLDATSASRRLAGSGWQQVTVTHRVRTQGAAIDLLVAAPAATAPFLVDSVTVRLERAPPQAPAAPSPDDATDGTAPLIANG